MMRPLSDFRTVLTYYGDDFTGSTDALEALATNGIESVLFLDTPTEDALDRFPACRAVGLAGEGRSRNPEWMSAHLPAAFERLRRFGAPICQYKVCSTFDSSPETGNIGRAAEIGQRVFDAPYVPVAVAAPHLKRYVLFENLFAAGEGAIHRIDRHPVMRCHPVTPMDEADLRCHLMRQTRCQIGSVDILALQNGDTERAFESAVSEGAQLIVFDGLDEASLRECGRLLWCRPPGFAVGSSGLTYALIWFWRACGWIPPAPMPRKAEAVDRLVVLSGSCSPIGERQLRWAMENGFAGVRLDAARMAASQDGSRNTALREGLDALADGRSLVLYSALGPGDTNRSIQRDELGRQMGLLLRDLLLRSGVRRAVIAGGDTSSHAGRQLGIDALTFYAPLSPGAPLCRAHSDAPELNGLQLVFKGGQVGPEDFFGMALTGGT